MAIHDQYTNEILEQLNYTATWLPTVQLVPGDVCDLRGREIQVVSHLNEFEIPFELEDRPVETDINYASAGGVSIHFKASGEPPPTGSLLDSEWPTCKAAFEQWLAPGNFDSDGRQRRSLPAIRSGAASSKV